MIPIGDPRFVYRPLGEVARQRLSAAQRKRLRIPDGFARVYGVHVPLERAATVRAYAAEMARLRGFSAAHDFVLESERRNWLVPNERLTLERIRKDDPRYAYRPRSWRIVAALFERLARLALRKRRVHSSSNRIATDWDLVEEMMAEGASFNEVVAFLGISEGYAKRK